MPLNKELCKSCMSNKIVDKKTLWNSLAKKQWKSGWIDCPLTYDVVNQESFLTDQKTCTYKAHGISIKSIPPCNCPFYLEHILKEEENVK